VRGRSAPVFFSLALIIAGCASNGEDDEEQPEPTPPTPTQPEELNRERIPVLTFEQQLEADPALAETQIILPLPYRNQNWSQAVATPSHAPQHLWLDESLSRVWRVDIGDGSDLFTRLIMPPVVAAGRVFTIDTRGRVSAWRAGDGERLWRERIELEGEVDALALGGGLAYDDGRLFVTTGHGVLAALDPETGEEIWRHLNIVPFRGPPTVANGRVFANTQDNQMVALDAASGAMQWVQAGLPEESALLGSAAPAVFGNTVVTGLSSGELMAMRVENGTRVWQDTLSRTRRLTPLASLADIDAEPVITGGNVYAVSHAGVMVAIDMRSGERVWENNIAGVRTPWAGGATLYVLTADAELVAISNEDGRLRWVTRLQRFENPEDREAPIAYAGPVLAGDRLIVVASNGFVISISPYTGDFLGATELPAGSVASPVVANGTLYIVTEDADLIAYR